MLTACDAASPVLPACVQPQQRALGAQDYYGQTNSMVAKLAGIPAVRRQGVLEVQVARVPA
jgi:hypothetical protein